MLCDVVHSMFSDTTCCCVDVLKCMVVLASILALVPIAVFFILYYVKYVCPLIRYSHAVAAP